MDTNNSILDVNNLIMDMPDWIRDTHDYACRLLIVIIELWSSINQFWASLIKGFIYVWLSILNNPLTTPNLLLFYSFHTDSLISYYYRIPKYRQMWAIKW